MILVDTDVWVDCLRGLPAATEWLRGHSNEKFAIPGVVAMELLLGSRDQSDLLNIQKFIGSFEIVWPEAAEFKRAFDLLAMLKLSSGIGIPDCLIAAMALTRQLRLYTFNTKHFQVVDGLDLQQPYSRV